MLTDVCTAVTQQTSGILSHKEGVYSYEYMHVLVSHEVNSLIVLLLTLKLFRLALLDDSDVMNYVSISYSCGRICHCYQQVSTNGPL